VFDDGRFEFGCVPTYQSRSLWCMPSIEINRTCLRAGFLPWEAIDTETDAAATPAATRLRSRNRRTTAQPPPLEAPCGEADLHPADEPYGFAGGESAVAILNRPAAKANKGLRVSDSRRRRGGSGRDDAASASRSWFYSSWFLSATETRSA